MSSVRKFSRPARPAASRKERGAQSFILLGGFLGAGKTTCLVALAWWLQRRGLRCGIITNDQGEGLVDTATAAEVARLSKVEKGGRGLDFGKSSYVSSVRQITGGCFCCRSGELMEAVRELEKAARPDVFLAEPVGSCTDLVATVLLPLEQVYKMGFRRAPMSVVLDGKRAWGHYFGKTRAAGAGFSKDVRYIYLKQMEEAEVLVVNKTDLLPERERKRLLTRLAADFPGKRVVAVSARSGEGMEEWFELLLAEESQPERVMEVDYKRYGRGEALMGWYNGKAELRMMNDETVDGNAWLLKLARGIQRDLEKAGVEIAHFKMSLSGSAAVTSGSVANGGSRILKAGRRTARGEGESAAGADEDKAARDGGAPRGLAVVNVVRNGAAAELSRRMTGRVAAGELLINLRAEGSPKVLERVVARHLKGLPVRVVAEAAFRPGMPKPVHRVSRV